MAHDVFISHSAQDKAVADAICEALENASIPCWVAPRDVRPGRSFPGEITRAIQQSKVMVLIFSRHSNNSEQVLREVQLAVDSHLPIVRFRIEDVPLTDDLRYYLSAPHWLDALSLPVSKHFPRLELAVKELLEQTPEIAGTPAVSTGPAQPLASGIGNGSAAVAQARPATKGKAFAIVALVAVIAIGLTIWAVRSSNKPEIRRAEAVVRTTPEPQIEASPTATAALPSATPAATIAAIQPPKVGPAPKNNRSWKAWIDDFVHEYVRSSESSDVESATSFFAPSVDLFEEGVKPLAAIRRDTEAYDARWPSRRATIRGDVQLAEKTPDRNYTARFEADYYVENATRGEWINLAVLVDLQIAIMDGVPRINSLKQKTLRKEKGTMQPRQ